ncbi:hypothetical protein [Methylobacter psychrophilus]|nr:hypothetical protein [Methylobacter psychrophilus]
MFRVVNEESETDKVDFDGFKTRLAEHFNQGYIMDDECVLDDIRTVEKL